MHSCLVYFCATQKISIICPVYVYPLCVMHAKDALNFSSPTLFLSKRLKWIWGSTVHICECMRDMVGMGYTCVVVLVAQRSAKRNTQNTAHASTNAKPKRKAHPGPITTPLLPFFFSSSISNTSMMFRCEALSCSKILRMYWKQKQWIMDGTRKELHPFPCLPLLFLS